MKKTLDTSVVTFEMCEAFRGANNMHSGLRAALEAAPGVKEEPFCYTHKNAQVEFDHGLSARIADFQDDYWSIPLYLHPPAQSGWLRAIDEALVCHHLDVANVDDSYEVAKDKLNKLLCCVQDIGSYFSRSDLVERIKALPRVYNPSAVSIDDVISLIEGAK
jgi:hypothetical protein